MLLLVEVSKMMSLLCKYFYAGAKFGPILCSPHGPLGAGHLTFAEAPKRRRRGGSNTNPVSSVPRFTSCDVIYRPTI